MLKKWSSVLVLGLVLGLARLAAGADDAPKSPDAKSIKFEIVGKQISINGTPITLPVDKTKLFTLLGAPSRKAELANTIHTWDALGLLGYETPDSGRIDGIHICFDKFGAKFWPRNPFTGTCTIDGSALTLSTTPKQLNDNKKGKPFEQHEFIKSWWILDCGDVSLVYRRPDLKEPANDKSCIELSIEFRQKR